MISFEERFKGKTLKIGKQGIGTIGFTKPIE